VHLAWQGSLLGSAPPTADASFASAARRPLDPAGDAWYDHVPGWVTGGDELFAQLADTVEWDAPVVRMYDRMVDTPRLNGPLPAALRPPVVEEMRSLLSERFGVPFTHVGANLYRDGRDSVAWHGDRVARELPEAFVAIVSLGGRRRFLLRPKGREGRGRSVRLELLCGDLLVMGGSCQRTWEHSVPKMAHAEPRMSITFRHAYDGVRTGSDGGSSPSAT
jgi:alkylated DNA repair dioxygenase AlkB